MILTDLHSHTRASHGHDDAKSMYIAAMGKGLDYFGISEHSPLPAGFNCALYKENLEKSLPKLLTELTKLKRNENGTRLLTGLELDWTPCSREWMSDLVHSFQFDYILGSLHFLDGKSVGNMASWPDSQPVQERYERFTSYYHEMASMCASGLIDIAAHADFIKLRVWQDFHDWLKTAEGTQAISHALSAMARHGVAMEINSAGLRQDFREFYPCPEIMSLAKGHGVKITFGSDAHIKDHIKADFASAENYAQKYGFMEYHIFIKREARAMPLGADT